jgi:hypothetical protein
MQRELRAQRRARFALFAANIGEEVAGLVDHAALSVLLNGIGFTMPTLDERRNGEHEDEFEQDSAAEDR